MKLLSNEWLTAPMDEDAQFEIRPLDALEFMDAQEAFGEDKAEGMRRALKSVVAWKGVEDADGNPLPFDVEMIPRLGIDLCDWLIVQIFEKSRLSEEQEKNLPSQSKSKKT